MQFEELKDNVGKMFPQDKNEGDDAYLFFMSEAIKDFKNRPGDLSSVWESIRAYDGNTKRPKFSFFISVAMGTKSLSPEGEAYWHCTKCKTNLSHNSDGGCPICHTAAHTVYTVSKKPVEYTACQSGCFDCSIYTEMVIGPTCKEFNYGYVECKIKNTCKCSQCCRFEHMRTSNPKQFKGRDFEEAMSRLPPPLSEQGLAFHEGRASFIDLPGFLKRKGK